MEDEITNRLSSVFPGLLRTKLYVPPKRPHLVPRPRLTERLNQGLTRKLTLISAPPGFGKTTTISNWIDQSQAAVAWLSLDDGDNDPIRFWSYFIAALQTMNAEDMARYLQTEHRSGVSPDGKQVISEAALHQTQSPEVAVAGVGISYGMGWVLENYHGLPLIWHNGGTLGFSSDLAFLPSADFGLVILSNAADGESFTRSVRDYAFELAFGLKHSAIDTSSTETQGAPALSALDPEAAAPFPGTYEHGVTIEMRGDELWLVGAFLQTSLHPIENVPGVGADSSMGDGVFSSYGVHFAKVGALVTLEITNLADGEKLTLNAT
ncbi:MAG: serine hydrolase [Chloroflexota bacterium]